MKLLTLSLLVTAINMVYGQDSQVDAIVQMLAETVDSLQAKVQALENQLNSLGSGGQTAQSVAFLAQYSEDNAVGTAIGPYAFDNVILNNGNGYDPTTGIFTAPMSGVYILAVQLFTDGGQTEHPFVDIKVNGNTAARQAFEEGTANEDSDSTMIIWQLQEGDKVWIASEEGEEYHFWGKYHTFFTGTLISPTPHMPPTTPVIMPTSASPVSF